MGMLGTLIPLVIFCAFLGGFAWVGYEMYLYSSGLADRGVKHLEKKNIVYTKDGMTVGVKTKSDEEVNDRVQSGLVKTWNLAGDQSTAKRPSSSASASRPATSRTSSGVKS